MATRRRASRDTITGAITDLQRRVRYLQKLPSPSKLANQVVRRVNVQPRAIDSDQLALRAIVNDIVEDDAIEARNLNENSVTSRAIEDGQVIDGKLGVNSVNAINIKDLNVETTKLANSAVTSTKLANAAVEESKIANSAVTEGKIRNSAVTTNKIDNSAVTTSKIASSAVTSNELATSSVTNAKIGSAAVTSAKIGTGAITNDKIAGKTINAAQKIQDRTIFSTQISTSSFPVFIIEGLAVGDGLSKSSNRVSVRFGTGSTEVPRGNHTHVHNNSYFTQDGFGNDLRRFLTLRQTSNPPSSRKVKKNISDHNLEDPKKLLKINLKRFKYKNSEKDAHAQKNREWMYGYLIEDLVSLGFEEVLVYNTKHEPIQLDYGLFSTLVLELVKVQQKELDELKKEVSFLRK